MALGAADGQEGHPLGDRELRHPRQRRFQEWVLYNAGARLSRLGINLTDAASTVGNEKPMRTLTENQSVEVERIIGGHVPHAIPGR